MTPQPQQEYNFYKLTRWDLEEYYDAIAHINGKAEADRMWERIERNTHSHTHQPAAPNICSDCTGEPDSCKQNPSKCQHDPIDIQALAATIRNQTLTSLYDQCECIPLKEYASDYDKGFHQAMTLVRGWIKQSLRNQTLDDAIAWLQAQKKLHNAASRMDIMDEIAKCGWKSRAVQCSETIHYLKSLRPPSTKEQP